MGLSLGLAIAGVGIIGDVVNGIFGYKKGQKEGKIHKYQAGLTYQRGLLDSMLTQMNQLNLRTYTDGLDLAYDRNEELLLSEFEQAMDVLEQKQGILDEDYTQQQSKMLSCKAGLMKV